MSYPMCSSFLYHSSGTSPTVFLGATSSSDESLSSAASPDSASEPSPPLSSNDSDPLSSSSDQTPSLHGESSAERSSRSRSPSLWPICSAGNLGGGELGGGAGAGAGGGG
uniref:Uncharacterized protein n=1 Tax=Arundo donax TaxID=35708 RepID=A0A0A9EGJ1_ARUDO